jgi:hypothetical protein
MLHADVHCGETELGMDIPVYSAYNMVIRIEQHMSCSRYGRSRNPIVLYNDENFCHAFSIGHG